MTLTDHQWKVLLDAQAVLRHVGNTNDWLKLKTGLIASEIEQLLRRCADHDDAEKLEAVELPF